MNEKVLKQRIFRKHPYHTHIFAADKTILLNLLSRTSMKNKSSPFSTLSFFVMSIQWNKQVSNNYIINPF